MGRSGSGSMVGLLVYLVIIICIIICAIIKWLCKRCDREQWVENTVQMEGITVDNAKALYDVNKAHKRVVMNDKYKKSGRDGELNNGRVEAVHQDDFFHMQRWVKRIETAKRSDIDTFYKEIDAIVHEMNNRCNEYAIKPKERQRLVELSRAPEYFLRKYDNVFV